MEYPPSHRHMLAKLFNCDSSILSNSEKINVYIHECIKELNLGEINNSFFLYNPHGITLVILLNECQLTLNTNANKKYATVDLFAISIEIDSYRAFKYLSKVLKSDKCQINELISDTINYSLPQFIPQSNYTKDSRNKRPIISILGSGGGVAKSVLSILNKTTDDENDPINTFIKSSKLHLIDLKQKDVQYYEKSFPNLKDKISLHQFDVNNHKKLKAHLKETNTSIVLDISFGDTVDVLKCCNSLGILYINSAFESVSVDKNESFAGFSLQERYRLFESNRDKFKNTSAIICSGMNPGVVQWMAIYLMRKYPNKHPKACYIVENDTSFFEDEKLADKNTIYTTWYPEGFLDEAIYSYPTFMKKHQPLFLYNKVYELEFKVTLGQNQFSGCLMPHEEAVTLGKMFDMETGFIYKINDHTTNLIKSNLNNIDVLWNKPMKVLDPEVAPLKGDDLVGILLVFEDNEAYIYNKLNNKETYDKYKTNATYLQVAAGIYGALAVMLLDDIPQGIYYVDELLVSTNNNYGKYLSYYLDKFIIGENNHCDGDLINRLIKVK